MDRQLCVDAKTGTVHWQERVGGNYSAWPIYGGKVNFQREQGNGVVVKADKKLEPLAKKSLEERPLASYGVAEGAMFIPTEQLFRRSQNDE